MKFEQLLQIYWSRGFLYGGKVKSFNTDLKSFFEENPGMSEISKIIFVKRFELNHFFKKEENFIDLSLDRRKVINMYLSRIVSINNTIFELNKYNLVKMYLIKTFKGRCHFLGKPSRGQRTRSNSRTSYVYNKTVRSFIHQIKKNNVFEKKTESLNNKLIKKKIKKSAPKINMILTKKKKNLWF